MPVQPTELLELPGDFNQINSFEPIIQHFNFIDNPTINGDEILNFQDSLCNSDCKSSGNGAVIDNTLSSNGCCSSNFSACKNKRV